VTATYPWLVDTGALMLLAVMFGCLIRWWHLHGPDDRD
jgi:hypothetical protein